MLPGHSLAAQERMYDPLTDSTEVVSRIPVSSGSGFGNFLSRVSGETPNIHELELKITFPGQSLSAPPSWVLGTLRVAKLNWRDLNGSALETTPELVLSLHTAEGDDIRVKARLYSHKVENLGETDRNTTSEQEWIFGLTAPYLRKLSRSKRVTGTLGDYPLVVDSKAIEMIDAFLKSVTPTTTSESVVTPH